MIEINLFKFGALNPKILFPSFSRKKNESNERVESVADRFILAFEKHGIKRNEIPECFGHGLTYRDVATNENLLSNLTPDILKATCKLFGVRKKWLECVDEIIYETHNFYKNPAGYEKFITELDLNIEKKENFLEPILIQTTNTTNIDNALIIIVEHMTSISDSAVRYHLCNNWDHRYHKCRADLTACVAITFKRIGYMKGKPTNIPIHEFCKGRKFIDDMDELPFSYKRNWFSQDIKYWKPEYWVFNPKVFVSGLREGSFGRKSALSRLLGYYKQGLMETKYPEGKSSELDFRTYLTNCK